MRRFFGRRVKRLLRGLVRRLLRGRTSGRLARATIRRADWRFLLPAPAGGAFEHLVLLGGPADLARRLTDAGIARRVSAEVSPAGTADAVVVLDGAGARSTLEQALRCAAPDAVVYLEIAFGRRLIGSPPRRILRTLPRAGFETRTYLLFPRLEQPRWYLPIDGDEAWLWYFDTMFIAGSPSLRFWELCVRRFPSITRRLASALAPRAVAAWRAADRVPFVFENPDLALEAPRKNLRMLLLTAGGDEWNRVIVVPFRPGDSRPVAVLKLSRAASRNPHTENEQSALFRIREDLDEELRETVPRPLGTCRFGDLVVGAESYLPGRLLSATTGRWGEPLDSKIEDLEQAARWLAEFHRQTGRSPRPWSAADVEDWVVGPLERYAQTTEATVEELQLFERVVARARGLTGTRIPFVCQHYGFGVWNICRENGRIFVFDWEGADRGLPFSDMFYLALNWSTRARGVTDAEGEQRMFRELFCEPAPRDPASLAARRTIADYGKRLGLDPDFHPIPLVLVWVAHAVSGFRRREALQAPRQSRASNRYVRYVELLAASRDFLGLTGG
jgi:hypothetical protein